MEYIAAVLVLIVALEHLYILVLEMFLWTRPRTLKIFGMTAEFAESTKALAANQGLYNGFLSAGLFWGLLYSHPLFSLHIQVFFLSCVVVAAIYGGISVRKRILIVQGAPALLALAVLLLSDI